MGLLDLFNSPEGQQALGLLAAGGPQTDPSKTGFGQRLAAASGFADQWKKRQSDAQMDALKMQMFTEELALKKLAEQRAQSQWGWQEKALKQAIEGGEAPTQQTIPGQMSTPQMGGVDMFSQGTNITSPPQTVTSQPRPFNKLQNLELQSLAGVPNVNERFNMYKYGQEGVARKPGEVYSMADGSTQFGPPSIDKNMQLVPDGKGGYTVRPATGAIEAVNALSKADALGKGETDFISVPGGPNEPPRLMSKSEYARSRTLGTTAPTPPQGEQLPFNQGNAEVSPEILRAIQQDAAKNGGPAPTVILNSKPGTRLELTPGQQRTPVAYRPSDAQPSRFGTGMSQQEQDDSAVDLTKRKTLTESSTKAGVDRIYANYDAAKSALTGLETISEARKAVARGSYQGSGAELKQNLAMGIQAMGFDVNPQKVGDTGYLQSLLGEGILNKAKTLGANPTDNDAKIIRGIVGSIGTDPNALPKLLDHQEKMLRRSISSHNELYQNAVGKGFSSPFDMTVNAPEITKTTANPLPPNPSAKNLTKGTSYTLPNGQTATWDGMRFKGQ